MKNIVNPLSNVSKDEILSSETMCPSCLCEREATDVECSFCGIVFANYYRWSKTTRSKLTISGLYHLNADDLERLEASWSRVQTLYWSEEEHYKFMMQCLRLKSLPFAIHSYKKRLELFPDDDVAVVQIQKLKALAREWYDQGVDVPSIPFHRGLFLWSQALSVMGIVSGIVVLFLGLLTSTRGFYVLLSLVMVVAFMGLFVLSRRLRLEHD